MEHHIGDVCIYSYHGDRTENRNNSCCLVEIVGFTSDPRGVAVIKFLKVHIDDSGNGFFNYLLEAEKTMNASLKYLKPVFPPRN